jgi:hypothetical protein
MYVPSAMDASIDPLTNRVIDDRGENQNKNGSLIASQSTIGS